MSAVDAVETEVPERVRRRGLDPAQDQAHILLLIDQVVGHDDERALTSSLILMTLQDRCSAAHGVYDAIREVGQDGGFASAVLVPGVP